MRVHARALARDGRERRRLWREVQRSLPRSVITSTAPWVVELDTVARPLGAVRDDRLRLRDSTDRFRARFASMSSLSERPPIRDYGLHARRRNERIASVLASSKATTNGRDRRTPPNRSRLKRALIGRPRASGEMDDTLVSKKLALPIFASDPLSSVAYATESALVVLVAASATAAEPRSCRSPSRLQ